MVFFIKKNLYIILVCSILLLGFFLRFYNYDARWGLGYDQTHDAIVSRYALENFKIPLVGPFSSGAQFQTSGIWYIFISLSTLFFPYSIITPWVVLTFCFVILIFLMIKLAEKMEGKVFGLIVGMLTALSPSQIAQSLNLSLTAPMCFISFGAIYMMVKFVKTKKLIYLFFLSLFTSMGSTTHLSGAVLLILLFITIIFTKSVSFKRLFIIFIGLIIPGIPLIIFDLQNNFVNSTGLLNTIFYNQFNVSYEVLGRRWLTYLGVFWPNAWGYIIGGNKSLGYALVLGSGAVFFWQIVRRKITKEWLILVISFVLMVGAIRYVRTPIFDSYLIFLHPFVLLFSGYLIYFIFLKNKTIAILLFLVVVGFSAQKSIYEMMSATNNSIATVREMENYLNKQFPNVKFSIYDYRFKHNGASFPLVLSLYTAGKISDNGKKIGIVIVNEKSVSDTAIFSKIFTSKGGYSFLDISGSSSAQLGEKWYYVNPSNIYNSTENWYKK